MAKPELVDVQQKDVTSVRGAKQTSGGIRLHFADGFAKSMPLKKLGLSAEGIVWATLRVYGDGIRIDATFGPPVALDGATLRYLADPDYAASVDAEAARASIPNEKLQRLAAKHSRPRRRHRKPKEASLARTTRK